MHHLKLHHIIHGKYIKKGRGFVPRSHGLPKLSDFKSRINVITGLGVPAQKRIYENLVGGKLLSKKSITPLKYSF